MNKGIVYALSAAALFGASTPLAKILIGQVTPIMLAGLLYLGSGAGLSVWLLLRRLRRHPGQQAAGLNATDACWLGGAILCGGVAGPVLLMTGLALTPGSTASLLLNLEGVLTALLAWFVFGEQFDRRILLGMALIVLAGGLLTWEQQPASGAPWGVLAIAAACLCWAIDNNLTRKISGNDAVQISAIKGIVAAMVNLALACLGGASWPPIGTMLAAGAIGLCGYGLSLVLFVLALRQLGTARTGAYFSAAPFVGVVLSLLVLRDTPGPLFYLSALLMVIGIWLHLSEQHSHLHHHEPNLHTHAHTHDAHHRHEHDFPIDDETAHSHPHQHEALSHAHPHFPDIHHRHRH